MGTARIQNRTTYNRCPKDTNHPFCRVNADLCKLDGYQLAIMVQILSNIDDWKIVKYEIKKRLGFPREKFNDAWKSLMELGYINRKRIQGGYDYIIYEDPNSSDTMNSDFENSTSTTGTTCEGGILTTTNNNYNKEFTSTTSGTCEKDQFNELLELYPDSGTNQDGTTYPTKGKLDECFKAYTDYLKTKQMTHEEIMTALKVELQDRRNHGRTNYQPGLPKWIDRKDFEDYRGRSVEPNVPGYGETLE